MTSLNSEDAIPFDDGSSDWVDDALLPGEQLVYSDQGDMVTLITKHSEGATTLASLFCEEEHLAPARPSTVHRYNTASELLA